jgi:two-component system sensor kinase FixL
MNASEGGRGADAVPDLRRRLALASLLCLVAIGAFTFFDLYLAPPTRMLEYAAVKLVTAAVALTAYLLFRRARARGAVLAVGLGGVTLTYALCALSGVLAGESETMSILTVALALGAAGLLPWGVAPQALVAVLGAAACMAAMYGASGSLAPLVGDPTFSVAIGLGLSIIVASEFERGRRALARREVQRQRAEAEVQQLNEVLEARVAARTAALERSEAALSALIENAPDAIWSIDRNYRLIAFNTVAARRFREFGSAPPLEPPLDGELRAVFEEFLKPHYDRGLAGERFRTEHTLETYDGPRYFVTSFNPIVAEGEVTGVAVFSTDVTDRRHAEAEAREHHEQLAYILRLSTMGEMAAGLAHEINQPLGAIANYAQGCLHRLRADPGALEEVLPVIGDIAAQALRAGEIIRRLRTLVRKEVPRQDWFDFEEVVADAVRLVEPDARDQRVAIRCRRDGSGLQALGDRIQIEQVILNLLRNGIEAMRDWGGRRELTIETLWGDGERVELAVCDSGPGLPNMVAERAFEPFFSTKPGGLGMGLSISRSIVEAHHGRLWATTSADGGATFHFTLPGRPAGAAVSPAG